MWGLYTAARPSGCGSASGSRRMTALCAVGKSEASLQSRDIDSHFGDGKTGAQHSAAELRCLLRSQLGLSPSHGARTRSTRPSEPIGSACRPRTMPLSPPGCGTTSPRPSGPVG